MNGKRRNIPLRCLLSYPFVVNLEGDLQFISVLEVLLRILRPVPRKLPGRTGRRSIPGWFGRTSIHWQSCQTHNRESAGRVPVDHTYKTAEPCPSSLIGVLPSYEYLSVQIENVSKTNGDTREIRWYVPSVTDTGITAEIGILGVK